MTINELQNIIVKIRNIKTNEVFENCKFELKEEEKIINNNDFFNKTAIHLYINDKYISHVRQFNIYYKCRCNRIIEVRWQKFIEKQNSKYLSCVHCCQDKQFEKHYIANGLTNNEKEKINFEPKYKKETLINNIIFDKMSNEFKESYKNRKNIFSEKIFYKILKCAYKINNIIITDDVIKKLKFIYAYPTNNQKKFTQKIFLNNKIQNFDFTFKCSICGYEFHPHKENILRCIDNNLACKECNFSNKTFPTQLYEPLNIYYKSNLELDFIKRCENLNIKIINGPKIQYFWNNKDRIYYLDFLLPELNILVETKENHIFHRRELENGKWQAKENAGKEYAYKNNMVFELLFTKDLDTFFKFIV